ncbi:hypothetical protein GCM10017772_27140 [Promicromonospora soli]|uniref:Uncharacterized protein n=1 Tax=Promicromonospora soli TaxID=2035533 RepID=A0A919FXE1_9MICO|nr:hypothetical protein GCM10017772_27140 [Promicromonospora soli]
MGRHLLSLPHPPRYSTFHHRTRKKHGENYPPALNAQVKEVKSGWREFVSRVAWNVALPGPRRRSGKRPDLAAGENGRKKQVLGCVETA